MKRTLTIAGRELSSLFYSPIAYVVLGLFALAEAWFFLQFFSPGLQASMRPTFDWVVWILIFLAPALSMRLISEEFRTGTIEPLLTAPVSELAVIVGKWLGVLGFFCVLLAAPTFVLVAVLEFSADPHYGPIVTGLLGLLLVGAFYLSVGVFASAATKDQIISFLLTVFIISLFTIALYYLARAEFISNDLRRALYFVNVFRQYEDFSKGLLGLSNVVFFISGTALFLFMAVKVLESRRWR